MHHYSKLLVFEICNDDISILLIVGRAAMGDSQKAQRELLCLPVGSLRHSLRRRETAQANPRLPQFCVLVKITLAFRIWVPITEVEVRKN